MVGTAICGSPVRSAIALLSPVVEPPPQETMQSAPHAAATSSARSVTSTGVCISAPPKTPAARLPSLPAKACASGARRAVESTSALVPPIRPIHAPASALLPGPKTIVAGLPRWTKGSIAEVIGRRGD